MTVEPLSIRHKNYAQQVYQTLAYLARGFGLICALFILFELFVPDCQDYFLGYLRQTENLKTLLFNVENPKDAYKTDH